jgi:hypothetical protein
MHEATSIIGGIVLVAVLMAAAFAVYRFIPRYWGES